MIGAWRGLVLPIAATLILTLASGGTTMAADLENTLYMDVPAGRVVIAMRPDLASPHVEQIKRLTRQGFYDGAPFHRVIAGFMAQTGDPTGTGTGGSGSKLKAEFSKEHHLRGTVSIFGQSFGILQSELHLHSPHVLFRNRPQLFPGGQLGGEHLCQRG